MKIRIVAAAVALTTCAACRPPAWLPQKPPPPREVTVTTVYPYELTITARCSSVTISLDNIGGGYDHPIPTSMVVDERRVLSGNWLNERFTFTVDGPSRVRVWLGSEPGVLWVDVPVVYPDRCER